MLIPSPTSTTLQLKEHRSEDRGLDPSVSADRWFRLCSRVSGRVAASPVSVSKLGRQISAALRDNVLASRT